MQVIYSKFMHAMLCLVCFLAGKKTALNSLRSCLYYNTSETASKTAPENQENYII